MNVSRFWFGATVGKDGRIYVSGGIGGPQATFQSSAEAYAPNAGWTKLAPMPEARAWGGNARTPDGRILTIGGSIPTGIGQPPPVASMVAYDPKTDTWTK